MYMRLLGEFQTFFFMKKFTHKKKKHKKQISE